MVEEGFLEELAGAPDDDATRLVYADWLSEQGDPRAEFLRIDHRLLTEQPAFLRRRFIELQAALDPRWVMRVARRPVPLAELRVVLPPPPRRYHPNGSWGVVEAALGTRLPADYKAFLDVYGRGSINNCLEIDHPFSIIGDVREEWGNWARQYDDWREYREAPYPVFPEPGGMLPFGSLGDVHALGWLTVGAPEDWPLVYHSREEGFFEVKGLSAVEFLLEAVTRRSPLLLRLGHDGSFDGPNYFAPHWPDSRSMRLVHPAEVDLEALAGLLTSRWPAEEVRIVRWATGMKALCGPLRGDVLANYELGGTWLGLSYGPAGAPAAALLEADLRAQGFGEPE